MSFNYNFKKVLAITLFTFTVINLTVSQTDTIQDPFSLNGHKFVVNSKIGSPFVNTYFKNNLGAGQTVGLEFPEIVIKGKKIVQLQGEVAFTNIAFEYQQEIRDWMAFYADFKLLGRLGTETGALISQGVNIVSGYNFGWKFKLLT